jgi:very-short-patch-repair endonuclease
MGELIGLTPMPPLHGGEGEKPTRPQGVIRNQKINPKKLELARQFRKNPTESEDVVWQMLRNRQIKNLKWRRQQVIDGFIADFYCAELNVVLEIDGSVHDKEEVKEYDAYRTSVFESKSIRIFRLKNEDCDKQHLTELIENIIKSVR